MKQLSLVLLAAASAAPAFAQAGTPAGAATTQGRRPLRALPVRRAWAQAIPA
jgi:hypothetical protein